MWFEAQKLKCGEKLNRKGNASTWGIWNQISVTLQFLLCACWFTMNAAPDNLHDQCNLSRFFFSSFSHPLVLISFFSFFHFSHLFLSLCVCRGYLAGARKESCGSWVCTDKAKGRKSFRRWASLICGIYNWKATQRCRHCEGTVFVSVCVCGCVSIVFGDECKVVLTAALVGIFNNFLFAALKTFSWIEAFLFRDLKS